jgi:hypothetical protein
MRKVKGEKAGREEKASVEMAECNVYVSSLFPLIRCHDFMFLLVY